VPRRRTLTWPVASGSLIAGFAVAQATGVRPLGGLVLAAALAWCFARWRAAAGTARAAGLAILYGGLFVLSHVIAAALGTWGAVFVVAAVAGAASWAVADARERPVSAGARRAV
jgi:hypothetical protein